jgi:hypothetical protein
VSAGNLSEVDTESRLRNRSAELDGDRGVVHSSDGCAGSVRQLGQRVGTIPEAARVLRPQPLEGPRRILRVAIGVEGEPRGLERPENARPVTQGWESDRRETASITGRDAAHKRQHHAPCHAPCTRTNVLTVQSANPRRNSIPRLASPAGQGSFHPWKLHPSCGLSTWFTPESRIASSAGVQFQRRGGPSVAGRSDGSSALPHSGDQGRDLVELVAVYLKLDVQVVTTLQVHPEPVGRSQRPGQP